MKHTISNWVIVVSVATFYGLDGPEIQSLCGRDFLHTCRLALVPTQQPRDGIDDTHQRRD